ncbi:hypothetical protein QR680_006559 [Steinernema hermaphroditum]|uniref:Insulin-like domain-containing protein n=1 Tax=Steinernema hermaphroditum TaxID=289476 RepID=A0AA39HY77_9BILA|nr:hypothetical protein QR680_006559 [Steinernema hermaphroditum]
MVLRANAKELLIAGNASSETIMQRCRSGLSFDITVIAVLLLLTTGEISAFLGAQKGIMKMCPPGGEAFATAWQLTCGMKRRRKRDVSVLPENSAYRPLSLTEMMHYCCRYGCTFRDLLPYCDPFGQWDS